MLRSCFLVPLLVVASACSSSSSSPAAPACDDTPVPATAGASCSVAGAYVLTSKPRCLQEDCSEDAEAAFDVVVTCAGNDCTIEGSRTTATSSTAFSDRCTLDGCACRVVAGSQAYVFDASGFVGEGPALTSADAGGPCGARHYYRATKK